jgi:hypothetical protein
MKYTLHQYLDQENRWASIFDKSHVDIHINTMTQKQGDQIIARLDSQMSPENLHCDGEISHSQARAKYDYYMGVWEDLKDLYTEKGWALP